MTRKKVAASLSMKEFLLGLEEVRCLLSILEMPDEVDQRIRHRLFGKQGLAKQVNTRKVRRRRKATRDRSHGN